MLAKACLRAASEQRGAPSVSYMVAIARERAQQGRPRQTASKHTNRHLVHAHPPDVGKVRKLAVLAEERKEGQAKANLAWCSVACGRHSSDKLQWSPPLTVPAPA
jgi:hypothetical protein